MMRPAFTRLAVFMVAIAIVASPTFGRAIRSGVWSGVVLLAVFAGAMILFVRSLQQSKAELAARQQS